MAIAKLKTEKTPLVLIIDDEELICASLSDVLKDEGYATVSAQSGAEGIEVVRSQHPDLVFLDIWMPGQDGIETLEAIKREVPGLPVVMISGHATVGNALEAIKRGAFDLIEKPLDIESISVAAKRALEKTKELGESSLRAINEGGEEISFEAKILPALTNAGAVSTGLKGRNLGQRTLKESAVLYGHCLHSGVKSGLVLEPLPPNSGIHFAKIGDTKAVPAFVDFVESTDFATRLRQGSTHAATIEHLMAALHTYRISNLLVKCNGEVPIFDGSSNEFCRVIEEVGIEEQQGDWFEIAVQEPVKLVFGDEGKSGMVESVSIEPSDTFSVHYELHYPDPVGYQSFEYTFEGVEHFKREIAPARTFGMMRDIERLQRVGLAAGGRLNNFILIGEDGVLNTDLRFPDELARHKVLDLIGDIFLLGRPIRGKVHACMTGHTDNVKILQAIRDKVVNG